ncbi:MAG: AIR synthase [Porphyromonadaceae bacterium]|nr:AIR synthase [Porphyromonadaceae bacterium]
MESNFGKIEKDFFKQYIENHCGKERKAVTAGPKFGVDVSVVTLPNNMAMALASDPLSLIPQLGLKESAWLSVHLTANDIATTSFAPMYGQFILNLPSKFSEKEFQTYWSYISQFCEEIGLAITGGHTGFVEGQNSTIAGGATFITIAPHNQIITSKNAKPGDAILVTKSCAISTSAILAMSFPETVKNKVGTEIFQQARDAFYDISVLKDALTAVQHNRSDITAMHDVTEGGVLGAVYELAAASENGAEILNDKLPVDKVHGSICDVFSLDPRYCVGAGSLLITCKRNAVTEIISQLQKADIQCTEIGKLTEKSKGIKLIEHEKISDLIYFEKDPYWEAFFKAQKLGWK